MRSIESIERCGRKCSCSDPIRLTLRARNRSATCGRGIGPKHVPPLLQSTGTRRRGRCRDRRVHRGGRAHVGPRRRSGAPDRRRDALVGRSPERRSRRGGPRRSGRQRTAERSGRVERRDRCRRAHARRCRRERSDATPAVGPRPDPVRDGVVDHARHRRHRGGGRHGGRRGPRGPRLGRAAGHRLHRSESGRTLRSRGARHARRGHHRGADQQRARHRGRGAGRADPARPRARRGRKRRVVERRGRHHLGRRPWRPSDQCQLGWWALVRGADGDPVRAVEARGGRRGRRQQRREREHRGLPGGLSGSHRGWILRPEPGEVVVLELGELRRSQRAGQRNPLHLVDLVVELCGRQWHVDGHAVRRGRSRSRHRHEPEALGRRRDLDHGGDRARRGYAGIRLELRTR